MLQCFQPADKVASYLLPHMPYALEVVESKTSPGQQIQVAESFLAFDWFHFHSFFTPHIDMVIILGFKLLVFGDGHHAFYRGIMGM